MTIYKGGQVIKYGFSEQDELPTVIAQSVSNSEQTQEEQTPSITENDFAGQDDEKESEDPA